MKRHRLHHADCGCPKGRARGPTQQESMARLRAALATSQAAHLAEIEAHKRTRERMKDALGEIMTTCEEKDLRYYRALDEGGRRRQIVIDYIHGFARRVLGEKGER